MGSDPSYLWQHLPGATAPAEQGSPAAGDGAVSKKAEIKKLRHEIGRLRAEYAGLRLRAL